MQGEPSKILVDAKELADLLSVSTRPIVRLQAQGMPTVKVGRCTRYEPDAVRAWLVGGQIKHQQRRGGRPRRVV